MIEAQKPPLSHNLAAPAEAWFAELRDRICAAFESVEDGLASGPHADLPAGRFTYTPWKRPEGGGGASKRDAEHRRAMAGGLRSTMRSSDVRATRSLASAIREGFASEDDFDACVAAIAMTRVVAGTHPAGEPADDRAVTACEGWILGRSARR